MTVLNHFVGEVFANVDVLGTLTSADDMVSPLDAGRVVFIDWRIIALREAHIAQSSAKIDDFDCHFGTSVVFCFCS